MSLGTEHSFKYSTNLQGTRLRVRPCRKFIWVSKVIRNWSDYTSIFDWLRELTPLSKPIKCRTKTNRKLVIRVFGSLHASRAGFSLALCDNSRVPRWSFWLLSVCFCDIQSKTMTQGLQTVWNSETSISYFQYLIFSGYSHGHCDDEIFLAFILQGDQIRGKWWRILDGLSCLIETATNDWLQASWPAEKKASKQTS